MITLDFKGTGGFSVRVELEQRPDADNNCSILEATLSVISTRWLGVTYWLQGQVTGRAFSSNYDDVYADQLGVPAPVKTPWSILVQHEPDGTAFVDISVDIRGYTAEGGYGNGWHVTGSKTVALESIALASTVQITEGEVTTIVINRKNSAYTHLLQYSFGSLCGYITDSGQLSAGPVLCKETVLRMPIPEAFYLEIPDKKEESCVLTCITMDGDRQVGNALTEVFKITVPERYRPDLTLQLRDINPQTVALTGNAETAVRFMSQLGCEAVAAAQLGATVTELTANGAPVPVQLNYTDKVLFRAVDSRGYCTEQTAQLNTVPYVLLTVNGACNRLDSTSAAVEVTVRGSCYGGSFGVRDNALRLTVTAGGVSYTLEPAIQADRYEATLRLDGLGYEHSHTLTVTAEDALMTVQTQLFLGRGVPVFDWGRGDFAFHVPITAPSVNGIRNPALKAWPVGAVLLLPTDPAAAIGGKWEHITVLGMDAWRRIQGADVLGTAVLGQLILGTEE